MRILVVATMFPAISETFILSHVTGLIDNGCDVEILAQRREKFPKTHADVEKYALLDRTYYLTDIEGTKFKRLAGAARILTQTWLRTPTTLKIVLNFSKLGIEALKLKPLYHAHFFLSRPSYDVVHCHYGSNGLLGMKLKQSGALKGRLVVSFHGNDLTHYVRRSGERVYRQLFKTGDLFLPVSNRFRDELIRLGCSQDKIRVQHMGVDTQQLRNCYSVKGATESFKALSVGRLVEKKGFQYSIEAFSKLSAKFPEASYDIIGEGPLRERLQQLITAFDLAERVRLLGWKTQEEVIERMAAADLLVAPSVTALNGDQEGIPVVLMEAMALGVPVLATVHSGIPELVAHDKSGYLVAERDVDGLASVMARAIRHPEERSYISAAGRRRVEDAFNVRVQNQRLMDLYLELTASVH